MLSNNNHSIFIQVRFPPFLFHSVFIPPFLFRFDYYSGSIPTVVRHIFQACPVWIYTQSNITSIIFTWVAYIAPTQKIHKRIICLPYFY
jgi:hypothetical protein